MTKFEKKQKKKAKKNAICIPLPCRDETLSLRSLGSHTSPPKNTKPWIFFSKDCQRKNQTKNDAPKDWANLHDGRVMHTCAVHYGTPYNPKRRVCNFRLSECWQKSTLRTCPSAEKRQMREETKQKKSKLSKFYKYVNYASCDPPPPALFAANPACGALWEEEEPERERIVHERPHALLQVRQILLQVPRRRPLWNCTNPPGDTPTPPPRASTHSQDQKFAISGHFRVIWGHFKPFWAIQGHFRPF